MFVYYLLIAVAIMPEHPLFMRMVGPVTAGKCVGLAALLWSVARVFLQQSPLYKGLPAGVAMPFAAYYTVVMISCLMRGTGVTLQAGDFTKLVAILALCVTTYAMVDSPERLRRAVLGAVICTAISSLYAIKQYLAFRHVHKAFRSWGGVSGDPNYYAISVAIWVPVAVLWALRGSSVRERLSGALWSLMTLLGFAVSGSRGGLLSLGVSSLFLALVLRRLRYALALCIVLLPLMFVLPNSPLQRLAKPTISDTQSADSRLLLWKTAWRMFLDHPGTGVGSRDFSKQFRKHEDPKLGGSLIAIHNTYLECLALWGLAGGVPFAVLLVSTWFSLGRVARKADAQPGMAIIARGLQTGLLGYCIGATFVSAWWQMTAWLLLALAASTVRVANLSRIGAVNGRDGTSAAPGSWQPYARPAPPPSRLIRTCRGESLP